MTSSCTCTASGEERDGRVSDGKFPEVVDPGLTQPQVDQLIRECRAYL